MKITDIKCTMEVELGNKSLQFTQNLAIEMEGMVYETLNTPAPAVLIGFLNPWSRLMFQEIWRSYE